MRKIIVFCISIFILSLFIFPSTTFAAPCGTEGQPCCIGGVCNTGLFCSNPIGIGICSRSSIPTPKSDPLTGCTDSSINTAIGCIPVGNLSEFTGFLLGWAVGIGGGIAFILIIVSGFMIMTASGNPERLNAAKELMTSAIMGLIMLIFSVFILKLIGVDILGLPGIQ